MVRVNPSLYIASQYIAVFGRMPDPGGFRYWRKVAADGIIPLSDIVHEFVVNAGRAEFEASYGGKPFAEQLNILYTRLFNRGVDAEGLAYWQAQVDAGRGLWEVFRDVVWSAWHRDHRSEDWKTIHNKASLAMDIALWLNEPHELARWREVAEWSGPFLQAVGPDMQAYWQKLSTLQLEIDALLGHTRDQWSFARLPDLNERRDDFDSQGSPSFSINEPMTVTLDKNDAVVRGLDWYGVSISNFQDRAPGAMTAGFTDTIRLTSASILNAERVGTWEDGSGIPGRSLKAGNAIVHFNAGHATVNATSGIIHLGDGHDFITHTRFDRKDTIDLTRLGGSRPEDFYDQPVLAVFGYEPGRDVISMFEWAIENRPTLVWTQVGGNAVLYSLHGDRLTNALVVVGVNVEDVQTALF